jgi:hypothetical protein
MILLNFSHPLTDEQRERIESLSGGALTRVVEVPVHFDHDLPFAGQVQSLVDGLGLAPDEWQTSPILVVPPALSAIAVTLLAELHGRMGYFPPVVRLGPQSEALPPRYQVAEIINLQAVRAEARARR